jgi:CHAT domain-containing protein
MKKLSIFFIYLFFFTHTYLGIAQETQTNIKTEKVLAYFQIQASAYQLEWTRKDSAYVNIPYGWYAGLKKGMKGEIFGAYNPDNQDRSLEKIGTCSIESCTDASTWILVKIDNLETFGEINFGDFAVFTLEIEQKNRGIFFDLASLGIFIKSNSKDIDTDFYTFESTIDINNNNSTNYTKAVIDSMLLDIKQTASRMRSQMDDIAIEKGKFAGQTLFTVMEKSETVDIQNFLWFVQHYPAKYMGNTWKGAEIYATWLINGAIVSPIEVFESLKNAKNDLEFATFTKKYKADFDEDFNRLISRKVSNFTQNKDFKQAYFTLEIAEKSAKILQDSTILAKTYELFGNTKYEEKQIKEAFDYFTKAEKYYYTLKNNRKYAKFLLAVAEKLNDENSYPEAQKIAEKGIKIINKQIAKDKTEEQNNKEKQSNLAYLALLQKQLALSFLWRDDNDMAITYLTEANKTVDIILQMPENQAFYTGYYATNFYYLTIAQQNKKNYTLALEAATKAKNIYVTQNTSADVALMLTRIGIIYTAMNAYENAEMHFHEALLIAQKAELTNRERYANAKLADLYKVWGKTRKALEMYQKVVEYYIKQNDLNELATNYENMAELYKNQKENPNAITSYEEALKLYQQQKKEKDEGRIYECIASCYWEMKNLKTAKIYYQKSYQVRKKIGDESGMIYCLANLATITASEENNFEQAEKQLLEGIALAQKIKDNYILAWAYRKLAEIQNTKGQPEKAMQNAEKALTLFQKDNNQVEIATTLLTKAHFEAGKGNFMESKTLYANALKIAETLQNNNLQTVALSGIAWLEMLQSEFENAKNNYDKVVDLCKKADNPWGLAGAYGDFGNLYTSLGEYEMAKNYIKQSDSIYKNLNSMYSTASNSMVLGRLYYFEGNNLAALQEFENATKIFKNLKINDENLVVALLNAGECFSNLKQYNDAEKWCKEGLVLANELESKRNIASGNTLLGEILLAQKKYVESEKALLFAHHLTEKLHLPEYFARVKTHLGELYVLNNKKEKATKYLQEAIEIGRKIGADSRLWQALYQQGLLYKNDKKFVEAKTVLKEAIELIEKLQSKVSGGEDARKIFANSEEKIKVYEALVSVLLQLGDAEEAFDYVQRNNADDLKNKYKDLKIKYKNTEKQEAIDKERSLKAKIENLEKQLITTQNSINTVDKAQNKNSQEKIIAIQQIKTIAEAEYNNFVNFKLNKMKDLQQFFTTTVRPVELRKSKALIPADMAIISYLVGEENLYIFVTTKEFAIGKEVPVTSKEIKQLVNTLNSYIVHKTTKMQPLSLENTDEKRLAMPNKIPQQSDKFLQVCEQLYIHLIAPIHNEIKDKKRLAIIPTGRLHLLPFQVIGKTLAKGNFSPLIEQHSIFLSYSLDMLSREEKTDSKSIKILAFGNPDGSLPAAETEVQKIKEMYPNTTAFVQSQATEDKAKDKHEGFNIMHFATHGNLNYTDFSQSFLTMAANKTKNEDGNLTLEELLSLDLMHNFNLVVLSACQTAVSEKDADSSPVSPASSFLQQGVKAVMASLWSVDDNSTALYISEFYNNLKTMEMIEAIRLAQIKVSQEGKYSQPYYWCPFVLMGDWK